MTSGTHAIVIAPGRHAGRRRRSRGAKAWRWEIDDPLRMNGMPTRAPSRSLGAGIVGLWQALTLARAGHRVRLIERAPSRSPGGEPLAGVMLAPYCEAETARADRARAGPRGRRAVAQDLSGVTVERQARRRRRARPRRARALRTQTEGHRTLTMRKSSTRWSPTSRPLRRRPLSSRARRTCRRRRRCSSC